MKEGDHKCDRPGCEETYVTKELLKLHISRDHEGVRYQCTECGQYYTSTNGLKLHINGVHLKTKRFFCFICTYDCLQSGQLNSHMKTVHAEGKDAQLWKYDADTEVLSNSKGGWKGRKAHKCFMPAEGEIGHIENDYCHVLGVENGATAPGSTVVYESKDYTDLGDHHLWLRGKTDKNGYFTIQNPATGLYLTSINSFNTKIEHRWKLDANGKVLHVNSPEVLAQPKIRGFGEPTNDDDIDLNSYIAKSSQKAISNTEALENTGNHFLTVE